MHEQCDNENFINEDILLFINTLISPIFLQLKQTPQKQIKLSEKKINKNRRSDGYFYSSRADVSHTHQATCIVCDSISMCFEILEHSYQFFGVH